MVRLLISRFYLADSKVIAKFRGGQATAGSQVASVFTERQPANRLLSQDEIQTKMR